MADIPPGPWTWQRVHPLPVDDEDTKKVREERWGEALVAADDTWLLSSESGWGRPEVHPQLRKLLPLLAPDAADLAGADEADGAGGLLGKVRRLTAERDQARALAWSYEHRSFSYAEIGIELDAGGEPVEPAWLTSPAAPYEEVLDADLARFAGSGFGTVYGPQVASLAVGDYAWVTDKGEAPGDVDMVYAQVCEVGDGWVRIQILTDPTEVRHAP